MKQTSLKIACLILGGFFISVHSVQAGNANEGYWKFDDASYASGARDESHNGNTAVATGTPAASTDVPATIQFSDPRSVYLDGSTYFTINRPIQNDFTICAWTKTLSRGNGPYHWQTAALFDSEIGSLGDDIGFGIDDSGHLTYGNGGAFDTTINGSQDVADNAWHHLCATRDQASGVIKVYVDGSVDATGVSSTSTLSGNAQAIIGNGTDGALPITGYIDDYRIYGRVLSLAEIQSLANGKGDANNETVRKAKVTSWKASMIQDETACPEKLRFTLSGKYFDDAATVKIGGREAVKVDVISSKKIRAYFCAEKLWKGIGKSSVKKSISVKNPSVRSVVAPKKLDLSRAIW